jgi:uncharacterized protein
MFGFGLSKLIVLILVILGIWYGFKYMGRVEEVRQALRRAREAAERQAAQRGGGRPKIEAEDMVKCRACGTYVPARGASNCGRPDCPW